MAKQYIYSDSAVFRGQYIDEYHIINVTRNTPPKDNDERYYVSINNFIQYHGIDKSDFDKIAKTISIEPELNPENGIYYLDLHQYHDMDEIVKIFLKSNNSLSKDISQAIKNKLIVEVDAIPEKTIEDEEVNQSENTEYNKKKFTDTVRRKGKREIGKKFIVGKKYFLRIKTISEPIYKIYELKKFIYSINNRVVNVVVMKRINGEIDENNTFTLSKTDCIKYHIKYEAGLQVFPMELNWGLVNENNIKFKKALEGYE